MNVGDVDVDVWMWMWGCGGGDVEVVMWMCGCGDVDVEVGMWGWGCGFGDMDVGMWMWACGCGDVDLGESHWTPEDLKHSPAKLGLLFGALELLGKVLLRGKVFHSAKGIHWINMLGSRSSLPPPCLEIPFRRKLGPGQSYVLQLPRGLQLAVVVGPKTSWARS